MTIKNTFFGSFCIIPEKIFYDDKLPSTAKLLYGFLFYLSNLKGISSIVIQDTELAETLDCSMALVQKILRELERRKYISREIAISKINPFERVRYITLMPLSEELKQEN